MEASITFSAMEYEDLRAGETSEVNGVELVGPVRIYRRWKLESISLCRYGMDGSTGITPVKMSKGEDSMESKKYSEESEKDEKEKVENTESGGDDKDALIAALQAKIAELEAQLETQGSTPKPVEENAESSEDEEEKKEKETLSKISQRLENVEDMVQKMYSTTQLGFSPAQTVKREEYASSYEYLAALEMERIRKTH